MYDYLKGALVHKTSHAVVLDVGGIGFNINISLQTYASLDGQESAKLYIHYHVNGQDYIPTLFGFTTVIEREVFLLLTSVQGVGTNTARIILSSLQPQELATAISQEREDVFRGVKGVGPKTAKRIILDLKDKISKVLGDQTPDGVIQSAPVAENSARQAALQALLALGYAKIPAQRALNSVIKAQPNLTTDGELVRASLAALNK